MIRRLSIIIVIAFATGFSAYLLLSERARDVFTQERPG